MKRQPEKIEILDRLPEGDPDTFVNSFADCFPTPNDGYSGQVNPDGQCTIALYSPSPKVREWLRGLSVLAVYSVKGALYLQFGKLAFSDDYQFLNANRDRLFLLTHP